MRDCFWRRRSSLRVVRWPWRNAPPEPGPVAARARRARRACKSRRRNEQRQGPRQAARRENEEENDEEDLDVSAANAASESPGGVLSCAAQLPKSNKRNAGGSSMRSRRKTGRSSRSSSSSGSSRRTRSDSAFCCSSRIRCCSRCSAICRRRSALRFSARTLASRAWPMPRGPRAPARHPAARARPDAAARGPGSRPRSSTAAGARVAAVELAARSSPARPAAEPVPGRQRVGLAPRPGLAEPGSERRPERPEFRAKRVETGSARPPTATGSRRSPGSAQVLPLRPRGVRACSAHARRDR